MDSESRVVAIHQPNFFPWLGFFEKLLRSDSFVILDDVQLQRTGGCWTNRVQLLISGEARWITAPIGRAFNGLRKINEIEFSSGNPWREKMAKSLALNYCRHPFYVETMDVIDQLLNAQESNVASYNLNVIEQIAVTLEINLEKITCSSSLNRSGSSNGLLCELTKAVGGNIYLAGGGSDGYQDQKVFRGHGVELNYQNFVKSVYPQHNRRGFVAGLSVIDAAMNLGWAGVSNLLRRNS